jgi:histidine ammonia-lyase
MAELGRISERHNNQLPGGKRGRPHFLVANPSINSGFIISQYTAATIVNQNKQFCTPASVDTIESSPYIENLVSKFRQKIKFIENDKIMHEDTKASVIFLKEVDFDLLGEDVRKYQM